MRAITFKRDSWHGWIAVKWGKLYDDNTDICTYSRKVLWGAVKLTITSAVLLFLYVFLGGCFGDFLGWVIAGLVHEFVHPEVAATLACGLLVSAVVVALLGLTIFCLGKIADSLPNADAFVPEAYRSWKDKVCFRVTLK